MHRWMRAHPEQRRLLFLRFMGAFGLVVISVLGALAALAFVLSRLFGGGRPTTVLLWVAGVGLALTLPLLAGAVALQVIRRITTPLADLMAAADAVADGDLSVRVAASMRGEFGRLAQSFNHMVEELERAERRRRNLTADVAHELRTPIQVIRGNLEGLLDEVYEPTPDHLEATLEETRSLARLVDDLQTISLAESGELSLVWEQVDVAELLADVRTSFSGQAELAEIELSTELEGDATALALSADIGRLNQVLSNLITNALRHTQAGGRITLSAKRAEHKVRIYVRDTGEGISAEDLPYVFDRFWRGDRSRSRASGGGSGLGLAIARQLVQAHGGSILVESKPGEGSLFIIELPETPGTP